MAVKTLQITQTGSAIQLSSTKLFARWILFQNAAAATMALGDSTAAAGVGYTLPATTGSLLLPALADVSQHYDLSQFWTLGTNTQVLNILYDSMS
jgi:hypothetical protein